MQFYKIIKAMDNKNSTPNIIKKKLKIKVIKKKDDGIDTFTST